MIKGMAEILKEVSNFKGNRKGAIAFLQENKSDQLQKLVNYCYNPTIKWAIPPGKPPYTPLPKERDAQHVLYKDIRILPIFIQGPHCQLSQVLREQRYIETLESIDPDDAELLIAIKDGNIPYPYVTKKLFLAAWGEDIGNRWDEK